MIRAHLSHSFVSKVLAFGLLAVQGALAARLLGPEGKGAFSFFQADLNLFVLLLGFGLRSAAVYFVSSRKMRVEDVLGTCLVLFSQSLLLLSVLLILSWSVPSLNFIFPPGYRTFACLAYLVASYVFGFIGSMFSALLAGKVRFFPINHVELGVAAFRAVSTLGLFLLDGKGGLRFPFEAILLLDVAATFLMAALMAVVFIRLEGVRPNFRLSLGDTYKPFLSFTLPLYFSALINFAYMRIDFWIIEKLQGLGALGLYSVSTQTAQMLTFVPTTIAVILYPHLAGRPESEAEDMFKTVSRANFTAVFTIAAGLFLVADPLLPLAFGSQFSGSVLPFRLLVWGYVILSVKHLFLVYFQVRGLLRINIQAEAAAFLVSVPMNLALVPRLGILGASLTMVASNLIALILVYRRRPFRGLWSEYFVPTRADLRRLLRQQDPVGPVSAAPPAPAEPDGTAPSTST